MKITLHEIPIREVVAGYVDNDEEGVMGFGGKLNIRPPYQREFVYKDKDRDAVIDSVFKNYPLNVIYWVDQGSQRYEVLDGQQRLISICQYVDNDFPVLIDGHLKFFGNLLKIDRDKILEYKLMVYFCEGNDKEKLEWFRIINIAGVKLTDQELRNAVYTGPWLSEAKILFSKTNCVAYRLAKDYINGLAIRQEILELALKWISKGEIEKYMSAHQFDPNANDLWRYFRSVIDWVKETFIEYRREMKGLDWGPLYDEFHDETFDPTELEKKIATLMLDDDVTNKKGIYQYVLSGKEKFLSLRAFSEAQKRQAYESCKGICAMCKKYFELSQMEADHITPWVEGGKTHIDNCQMLCRECNRRKSNK